MDSHSLSQTKEKPFIFRVLDDPFGCEDKKRNRSLSEQTELPVFEINADELATIVRSYDIQGFTAHGGVQGIARKVSSSLTEGIVSGDAIYRQKVYGFNKYPENPQKGFWKFVCEAFDDLTLIILMVCALISAAIGGAIEGWEGMDNGADICFCIYLVVLVSSASKYYLSLQFRDLDREKKKVYVHVTRNGRRWKIPVDQLVVGDVLHLSIGDVVPADGVFISGYTLQIDESSLTRESEPVYVHQNMPFLLSGTKVMDGKAKMLVTAVGMRTEWGRLMGTVSQEGDEQTPLQVKANIEAIAMVILGLAISVLTFIAFTTRFLVKKAINHDFAHWSSRDAMKLLYYFSAAVIVFVTTLPEGCRLAVRLSLAFAMKKLMYAKALVRHLSACETMGLATCICTDKTGTLTTNQMAVDKIWISGLNREMKANEAKSETRESVVCTLLQAIALNTGAEVVTDQAGKHCIIGHAQATETALVKFGLLLGGDFDALRNQYKIEKVEPFSSFRKKASVLVALPEGGSRAFCNGAAEMVLSMCDRMLDCNGHSVHMSEEVRTAVTHVIYSFSSEALRTLCLAVKDISDEGDNRSIPIEGYTLIGVVGIKDPVHPGVKDAVQTCLAAGITVRMVTGDNINTAKVIAKECGILTEGGIAIEGHEFRNKSLEERKEIVPRIQVIARSLPSDKHMFVKTLRMIGEIVAATGDGTNDAPALRESDIGLAMGIAGTQVAKENADVIILDENFATIVNIVKWVRAVYANIQRFLQFQQTINLVALVSNLFSACLTGSSPLKIVQWLWINLIQCTFAAFALATEPPNDSLMRQPPNGRDARLVTNTMWRNILGQYLYQINVLFLFFDGNSSDHSRTVTNTFIFNSFVFCQVFNQINCRDTEKKMTMDGMFKNWTFMGILIITVAIQVMIVEFLGSFASTVPLSWQLWLLSIGIGAGTMIWDFLLKFFHGLILMIKASGICKCNKPVVV